MILLLAQEQYIQIDTFVWGLNLIHDIIKYKWIKEVTFSLSFLDKKIF